MQESVTVRQLDFDGLAIRFDDRVLEPRPWTSAQSHWAADLLGSGPAGPVLELCAGVGHIGLLAVTLAARDLVMVDLDPTACEFARRNIAANEPAGTVEVREGPMDRVLAPGERFAGIIADPPWVPTRDVTRFPDDPLLAIDGGADGMSVAWTCVDVIARHLVDDGWALVQLGTADQAAALGERLDERPGLRLRLAEVREYGERGVLALLTRTPPLAS